MPFGIDPRIVEPNENIIVHRNKEIDEAQVDAAIAAQNAAIIANNPGGFIRVVKVMMPTFETMPIPKTLVARYNLMTKPQQRALYRWFLRSARGEFWNNEQTHVQVFSQQMDVIEGLSNRPDV